MATYNVELVTRGTTNWTDGNKLYLKTKVEQLSGFLSGGEIAPTYLPSYIGGGLKNVGTFGSTNTLLNAWYTAFGLSPGVGDYVIVTQSVTVADDNSAQPVVAQAGYFFWDSFNTLGDATALEEGALLSGTGEGMPETLEPGDWIVCTKVGTHGGENAFYFRIVNNQYRMAVGGASAMDGLMSAADKAKLDGIASGANNYSHPTQTAISVTANATPLSVIDGVTVDVYGHTTGVTVRELALATTGANGAMSKEDKAKLDGIATNANKYIHPDVYNQTNITTTGIQHIDYISSEEQTTYGHIGENSATTYAELPLASQTNPGVMSATDKAKLDGIAANANNYTHPTHTSRAIDNTDIQTIDFLTVDGSAHTSNATAQNIAVASVDKKGIAQFATSAEAQTGTDTAKVVTPAAHKAGSLFWAHEIPTFATLSAANTAAGNYEVGKLVMVVV